MKKVSFTLVVISFFMFLWAGSPIKDLKTEKDLEKFADKQFEVSMSHKANAGQTQNAKMGGAPIDNPELYKNVKKIAVLGLTVAFTSREGSGKRDEVSYAGIPVQHFNTLADSILQSVYKAYENQGFSIVTLDEVKKLPSYSKIDFGTIDESSRYSSDAWICTPGNSKWIEPDNVNSIKSGISFVHRDTLRARAFKKNDPLQCLVSEAGADAGINIAVRFYVYNGEIKMGWGPLKRGLVVDLIPATGDPRIIWSATLKSDLDLDVEIGKFDKKAGMTYKSWKYNLEASIVDLNRASKKVFESTAVKLKLDQSNEK